MIRLRQFFTRLRTNTHLADWLSLLGTGAYGIQSLVYIFTSRSMLDEGLYLVKGWYFATGQYTPFQDYGVLTNHMPFAFLIPGYVLKFFGANLLSGRVYAIALSLTALAALWVLARRLGGAWWGSFVVWALALNVAQVRIYSLALSQVLIAALVAGTLLISLRRDMRPWQVIAAGLLMGALVMVRINMLPLAILWLLYVWWQHGHKKMLTAAASFASIVIFCHVLYWPNILRLWAYWIPQGWIPGLEPFYSPWDKFTGIQITSGWAWLTNLDDVTWNPIISFWQGVRFNFAVMIGVLLNLLLWPVHKSWPDKFTFRAAIFLNTSFLVLLLVHMWAALGEQSCTAFCFSGYTTFFSGIGLLAIVVTAPHWRRSLHWVHQGLVVLVLLIVGAGVGFGTADKTGKFLAEFPIPRLSGPAPLWGYFENKFGVSYRDARKIIPALAGFVTALGLLAFAVLAGLRWKLAKSFSLASRGMMALFAIGFMLSPTPIFSLGDESLQCGGNLIQAYQKAGSELFPLMRSGERLYYQGPNSPAILLYLPKVEIYPPQLNNVFSFSLDANNSDSDKLLKFGYWNQALKVQWMAEADLVLLEARQYEDWKSLVETGILNIAYVSEPLEPCRGKDSGLVLLRRNTE